MAANLQDERQIISYLLGELPEDQQTLLEERYLRDLEYREVIRAVEDDLVDDYVRGELTPEQHHLFEKHFDSLPHRRQKVEFARALTKRFSSDPAEFSVRQTARERHEPRWWSSLLGSTFLGGPSVAYRVSLAALLLILIGGAWFFVRMRRAERERLAEQQKQQQIQRDTQAPPTDKDVTPNDQRAADSPTPVVPPKLDKRLPAQTSVATFILPPGMARNVGTDRDFVVPRGTRTIRLRLGLETQAAYRNYRAELQTEDGSLIWKGDLKSQRTGGAQSITLNIPAETVAAGTYELKLSGLAAGKPPEDIGYYYFNVRKE